MFVEIHLLQNFAPSNLNRDDTNSPKDCTFGGARRARISSQCLKRAIRQDAGFVEGVKGRVAKRTKLVHEPLIEALVAKGRNASEAAGRVQKAFEAVEFKWDEDKGRTSVLLFVAPDEIARWADVIDQHWDALGGVEEPEAEVPDGDKKAKKKTAKQEKQAKKDKVPAPTIKALKDAMKGTTVHAVDVALFGRMVAENTDMNVEAACQVAHAISTHAVQMEMDFFTAVDDLQPSEETGAGMMGVVEFNSACFYRYALVDVTQLAKSLGGDKALVRDAVVSFCEAAVKAIPTGKQNSFAARNPPDWVHVEVRDSGTPRSLVNAFAEPVRVTRSEGDLVGQSITRAREYGARLAAMLDDGAPRFVGTSSTKPGEGLVSLPALLRGLGSALEGGLA
jgi:CRISPR system Cascade subunit CasC